MVIDEHCLPIAIFCVGDQLMANTLFHREAFHLQSPVIPLIQ